MGRSQRAGSTRRVSWTLPLHFQGDPAAASLPSVPPAILLITTQNSDFISSPSEPSVGITGAG